MKVRIEVVYIDNQGFYTEFTVPKNTEEYVIADKAWDCALAYAETLCKAQWGDYADMNKLGEILKQIDYNYAIVEL